MCVCVCVYQVISTKSPAAGAGNVRQLRLILQFEGERGDGVGRVRPKSCVRRSVCFCNQSGVGVIILLLTY